MISVAAAVVGRKKSSKLCSLCHYLTVTSFLVFFFVAGTCETCYRYEDVAFWDAASCSLMNSSPWWWRQYALLKRRPTTTRLHGTISHKAIFFIIAAVRIWNLTSCYRYYYPSLMSVLQMFLLSRTVSAKFSSNNCSRKKSTSTWKRRNSETVSNLKQRYLRYLLFLLQIVSPTTSLTIVLELWMTLYMTFDCVL
jgi:hypothetical protein